MQSGDGNAAARAAFGATRDLENTLWGYRNSIKPKELWLKARNIECRKDLVVRPMTDEAGLATEAYLMLEDGHPQEAAQKEFLKAAELDPADSRPGYALGQNALGHPELGDASQSVAWLETSVRLDTNFAPARFALGQAYLATPGQKDRAAEAGRRACELDPVNLDYLVGLARIYLALRKQPEAQAVAKRAVSSAYMPTDRDSARRLQTEADR